MTRLSFIRGACCLLSILAGCKDPYGPPTKAGNNDYLVVEGYLNGNGSTSIRLSRTFQLKDSAQVKPELQATVTVQGKGGRSIPLSAAGNGAYEHPQLTLNPDEQYRLYIKTANNREYFSAYVDYKRTPEIDSISWTRNESGVQLYANTHDPQNKTKYYRWDFEETWEFHSPFRSFVEYKNGQMAPRDLNINISTCWRSNLSNNILLGSTVNLSDDIIALRPIKLIPNGSEMLSVRYSLNLKQYALTEEAYQYWQHLQKNSEKIGSLFDPQPSELRGNLYAAADPTELVMGYISAGAITEKRLFISQNEVPDWNVFTSCEKLETPDIQDSLDFYFKDNGYTPLEKTFTSAGEGYTYSTTVCIDCRLRGTNVKPLFW